MYLSILLHLCSFHTQYIQSRMKLFPLLLLLLTDMFRLQTAIIGCLNYAKTVPLYNMYKMFTYLDHMQLWCFMFKILDVTLDTYLHWLISFTF
jgi:hypothetical protein